jgi:hypothetical protein
VTRTKRKVRVRVRVSLFGAGCSSVGSSDLKGDALKIGTRTTLEIEVGVRIRVSLHRATEWMLARNHSPMSATNKV